MKLARLTGCAAAMVISTALASCGGGARHVARGEAVTLAASEGLLVLAFDSAQIVEVVSFCRERDVMQCVDVTNVTPSPTLRVVQLPAGRWCLDRFVLHVMGGGAGIVFRADPDEPTECVPVRAGSASYPGTLVFRTDIRGSGPVLVDWGFADRSGRIREDLLRDYPDLAGVQLVMTDLEPSE